MQVENFWGSYVEWDEDPDEEQEEIPWGYHEEIAVGRVVRNHTCMNCRDMRSFVSGETLSCLVVGERELSIDVALRCSVCDASTEAWFLVGSLHDLQAASPIMYLQRLSENRRDVVPPAAPHVDQIGDLLERAQIAHDQFLGAGSMIYLRKVFEISTMQAATAVGVTVKSAKGGRKPFRALLEEVDQVSKIVPPEFSSNGYQLFSELSEVIHGSADESEALGKYVPCRRLVIGVVENIRNNNEMSRAVAALGWTTETTK